MLSLLCIYVLHNKP